MKTNGQRLMVLDDLEQLEGDWNLIEKICDEIKKCQQLLEKSTHNTPVSKKKLLKSVNLIKRNHREMVLSFYLKARMLQSLSPNASEQIEKRLASLNDYLQVTMLNLKRWETDSIITVNHLRHDFVYLAHIYNEFAAETKMYRDLVKNTAHLMA